MLNFIKETVRSRKILFTSASSMVVILKICSIAPALLLGKLIDGLYNRETIDIHNIITLLSAFVLLIIVQSVINPLQAYQLVKLVQTTLKDSSIAWTKTILAKEFDAFSALRVGSLIKSVERGITAHEKLLAFFILIGVPLIIEVAIVALVFLYVGGGWLFLSLFCISGIFLTVCHYLINWRRPHLRAVNDEEDILASRLYETLQAGKSLKLERAIDTALHPLCNAYGSYAEAAIKVASSGAIMGSVKIIFIGLSTAGVLAWGIQDQLTQQPQLSIGELVALFSISGSFLANISGLSDAYRTLDQFLVDKQRLQHLLGLPEPFELAKNRPLPHPTLSRLSLGSANMNSCTPHNRPLIFNSSESVAIIGPSGAGKTTLLESLAGTLVAYREHIAVNDQPLETFGMDAFFNQVRYCPQSPIFLEGRFGQSVLYGQEASPALALSIAELGLGDIATNRIISEGAKNISGGEAKRLSLLRLINRPGQFNLFDEPTASLDHESAQPVWAALFSVFRGKGLICVTHDVQALQFFDRIIILKGNVVIADAPWRALKDQKILSDTLLEMNIKSE